MLYVVPTPIGNLEDITIRAVRILKESDLILAEDTRTSSVLLKHLGVNVPLKSFHKFNEHQSVVRYVEQIRGGAKIALISDAGTPGISDPGFLLVRECVNQGVEVCCLPGPTAFVPALVMSGFPTDQFCFMGFLPQKKGRQKMMKSVADDERTIVFYESPHRLIKALEQMKEIFGAERQISVSREISKIYEETIRGTITDVLTIFEEKGVRGEFVIVVRGKNS